ncbi:hypothetical protein [Roseiconus lacunae]|uniref:hypothetical protein n=1 Tax=Roseiconus lacunae TaxID=2605694 RepID=UPI001E315C63|nr:hypothetical protein [Roseiconus lacunae]MCD0459980.1 hypothetical protein [Roseiconus lacunae]
MSRYSWIALFHTLLLTSSVGAQYAPSVPTDCDGNGLIVSDGPHCDSPYPVPYHQPELTYDQPACATTPPCTCEKCQPPKQRRIIIHHCPPAEGENESADRTPQVEPDPGVFLAPPQSGERTEGYRTYGVRGMSIRFPEWKLSLPSIELPGFIRRSRAPQMELDRAVAPFRQVSSTSGQNASAYRAVSYPRVPATYTQTAPRRPSNNESADRVPQEDRCDALEAEMDQLKVAMAKIAQSQQKLLEATNKVTESLTHSGYRVPAPPDSANGNYEHHVPPNSAPSPSESAPAPSSLPPYYSQEKQEGFRELLEPPPSQDNGTIDNPPFEELPVPAPRLNPESNTNYIHPDTRSYGSMFASPSSSKVQPPYNGRQRRAYSGLQIGRQEIESGNKDAVLQSAYFSPVLRSFDSKHNLDETSEGGASRGSIWKPQPSVKPRRLPAPQANGTFKQR